MWPGEWNFIKTTYDISLDSQISLLPLGFSLVRESRLDSLTLKDYPSGLRNHCHGRKRLILHIFPVARKESLSRLNLWPLRSTALRPDLDYTLLCWTSGQEDVNTARKKSLEAVINITLSTSFAVQNLLPLDLTLRSGAHSLWFTTAAERYDERWVQSCDTVKDPGSSHIPFLSEEDSQGKDPPLPFFRHVWDTF